MKFTPIQPGNRLNQTERNTCLFSPDHRYRYLIVHNWSPQDPRRACVWIGLNPSIADEHRLDSTLRRIRSFSAAIGFNTFYMVNLFALVTSKSSVLKQHRAPIGLDNDRVILETITEISAVIVAWGTLGSHLKRNEKVLQLLGPRPVLCFGFTRDGHPAHPLYLPRSTQPICLPSR